MNTTAKQLKVNGKVYTVVSRYGFRPETGIVELQGPKGGPATLVQNLKHGYWTLLKMQGYRAKEIPVTSMEVVA